MNPWAVLGIAPGSDRSAIRRAYAALLRLTNPEDDPEGFMALRAAHDAALEQLRWRARPEPADDVRVEALPVAPPPPVPDPAETARQTEMADLDARKRALVAVLSDDEADRAARLAALDALLAAPALAGLGVLADTEDWLAQTIARFQPASDALVMPAIDRFDWDDDMRGPRSTAIAQVLRRRDEGEYANAAARQHAPLHVGFEALRSAPGPAWRMRIAALFTAAPEQVRTILAAIDGPLPGVADWLDSDAIAWWRAHLSRARLTIEEIMLAPFMLCLVAVIGVIGALPPWAMAAAALPALAAPWLALRLVVRPQRDWAHAPWDHPEWHWNGWIAALVLLLPLAAMLPAGGAGLLVLLAAAVLALGWTTVATPVAADLGLAPRFWRIIGAAWPLGVIGATGLQLLPPAMGMAWVIVTTALVIGWWRGGDVASEVAERWLRWPLPMLVLAALAFMGGALACGALLAPDRGLFVAMLGLSGAAMLLFLANRAMAFGRRHWLVLLAWPVIMLMLLLAIGAHRPAAMDAPAPRVVAQSPITGAVPVPLKPAPAGSGATVIGSSRDWLRFGDYPAGAFPRSGRHGVSIRFEIGTDGRVGRCDTLDKGTPDAVLRGEASCAMVQARARFRPARDAGGTPVPAQWSYATTWTVTLPQPRPQAPRVPVSCPADARIAEPPGTPLMAEPCSRSGWIVDGDYPEAALAAGQTGQTEYRLDIGSDGRPASCMVVQSSGVPALDGATCDLLKARARFLPARDGGGNPVPGIYRGRMRWELSPG